MKRDKSVKRERSANIEAFQEEKKQAVKKMAASKRFWFVLLGISIACEVTATISMKMAEGFTVLGPSIVTIAGYLASFILLVRILEHMPLGLVYGIWGGVGLGTYHVGWRAGMA